MIIPTTQITGDKQLDAILKDLGQNAIKDSVMKQGLKKLAKPFINDIRSNINDVTKNLSKSIGIIKGIRAPKGRPFVIIGPRYSDNYMGYHAHLVEVGKSVYNVEYSGQKMIKLAFDKNKTQTFFQLKSEIVKLLNKKLKKLK